MTHPGSGVCAPIGFRASGIHCGIRRNQQKKDLSLIVADVPCTAAAVYTRNKVCGAPIAVTRAHLRDGTARAVLCNSGNANTCNADGVQVAEAMCAMLAEAADLRTDDVIIASTGVIGQPLPLAPIAAGMPALVSALSVQGAQDAAEAILTTDLVVKQGEIRFCVGGVACTIGAMAKGSGMIAPNMATMLCFITTDTAISSDMLSSALHRVVDDTFNMLIVDGDTSTNDMVSVLASGLAGNPAIDAQGEAYEAFVAALYALCADLTRRMARDGEGATKLIACEVSGAPDTASARAIARAVIASPLCKTAMYGEDANWGRILCAIGYAPGDFAIDRVSVRISSPAGQVVVCANGSGVSFSEAQAKRVLQSDEITLTVDLHQGDGVATSWGCDLTHEYVRINGEYRT